MHVCGLGFQSFKLVVSDGDGCILVSIRLRAFGFPASKLGIAAPRLGMLHGKFSPVFGHQVFFLGVFVLLFAKMGHVCSK